MTDKNTYLPDNPAVNPPHYKTGTVELIEITRHLDFCRGNAVKYIVRAGKKAGSAELEDLQKARWYVDDAINTLIAEQEVKQYKNG